MREFINEAVITDLTEEVADKSIELRKAYKIKLPDAIIAATALVSNQALITRNTVDFKAVEGLVVINPWTK